MQDSEIQEHLTKLAGWKNHNHSLVKEFNFSNFMESVAFVNKIAPLAEGLGHHPDLAIQYSKVMVTLTTHDSGGPASPRGEVTEKDFTLASKIQSLT